jgi:hypothetical protein
MTIEYTIGVMTSDEGTIAANNPRVDSIEKLRAQYKMLLDKYGNNTKLHLFKFNNGERIGDFSFSELKELSDLIQQF